ncbi:lysophospholipid acyltransferase family protein [bacterium]|nr:lysophospholipid acyltransferase family protein [bacterium]
MKKRKKKKFQHRIEVTALKSVMFWIWILPLHTLHQLADCMGWFVFSVLRIRYRVVMANLAHAFPEKSERERKRIALRCYQNFAKTTFEFIRFPVTKRKDVFSHCEIHGLEHLDSALKRGKGALVISGHFGNWELIGAVLAHLNYPISLLVGKQRNRIADNIINRHRMSMGVDIIKMGISVRNAIKALRNNRFVAFLSDQNARKQGVFVDFFGKKASTPPGAAAFSLKTGAPILFFFFIRLPRGRYKLTFHPFIFDHLEGLAPDHLVEVTQAYTKLLEDTIRLYPDQYFWMHRRWKKRPPEEKLKNRQTTKN